MRRSLFALAGVLAAIGVAGSLLLGWETIQASAQRAALRSPAPPVPVELATSSAFPTPLATDASPLPEATVSSQPAMSTAPTPVPKPVSAVSPNHLWIPSIGVNTQVIGLPTVYQPDSWLGGQVVASFGVPDDVDRVSWWTDGPQPGADGLAVMLGHTQIGGPGVFNDLGLLQAGSPIQVQGSDGHVITFAVIAAKSDVSKSDANALSDALMAAPAGSRLALITCSGDITKQNSQSRPNNTVVFAKLVSES